MRRTARALVLAFALAVLLTGCHPPTLTKVRGWPGATPVFASEEEALAAAEEAYGEYLAVSDAITADGGANPERIEGLVTAEQYQAELDGFELFRSNAWHTTGFSSFEPIMLEYYEEVGNGFAEIAFLVCSDTSKLVIVQSNGEPLSLSGSSRQIVDLKFVNDSIRSDRLLLKSGGLWSTDESC
ncbi:MAG: hypothetical protein JWP85_1151 [Rhodoglobus sp.]|nr:hypothetical protein [Rhodoglobus sp.]